MLFIKQFIKFGVTGAIGAVVDFGTYFFLTRLVGWQTHFVVLGQNLIAANMVSVFLAIVSNYTINRTWTFSDRKGDVFAQGARYLVLNIATWALNQLLTSFFAFRVPWLAGVFGEQKDFVAKALAIGLVLIVNFGGSRFLIFNKKTSLVVREA